MEPKKTPNVPSNFEKKNKAEDIILFSWSQTMLQSSNDQNSKVFAQKQTRKTVDQN